MSRAGAQQRWLLSFADLALLLLAFFVMLHVRDSGTVMRSIGGALGAPAFSAELDAETVFDRGEAVLTGQGRKTLLLLAHRIPDRQALRIVSTGVSPGGTRFAGWELSAARAAAIARELQLSGIPGERIQIDMEPTAENATGTGQRLAIVAMPD